MDGSIKWKKNRIQNNRWIEMIEDSQKDKKDRMIGGKE